MEGINLANNCYMGTDIQVVFSEEVQKLGIQMYIAIEIKSRSRE